MWQGNGYDGALVQEGLGRKCCWHNAADGDLFCYIVDMKKGGGGDTGDAPVHRPAGEYCQHCNHPLVVYLYSDFCVEDAFIKLILTSSLVGGAASNAGGELFTNESEPYMV